MSHDQQAELITLFADYRSGAMDSDALRARLDAPEMQAALAQQIGHVVSLDATGVEQAIITARGDTTTVGNITNAEGVAIGTGAMVIRDVTINFITILAPRLADDPPSLLPGVDLPHMAPRAEWQIGHDDLLDQLHATFKSVAATRQGRCILLTGRDGYGKSALMHAFLDELREKPPASGVAMVLLRFWPKAALTTDQQEALYQDDPQLQQVAPLVEHVRRAWPLASSGPLGATFAWTMAQLSAELGGVPRPLPTTPDRLDALVASIRQVARLRPLVLAWENLEHAEDLWAQMIAYLLPELARELQVLLVGTLRLMSPIDQLADDLGEIERLARELQQADPAQVRWLDALDSSEVAEFLGDADPRLAIRLAQLTGGVPYLIESLWGSWVGEGVVADQGGRWEIATDRLGWVFGEQRDLAAQLLRLGLRRAPVARYEQAMEILHCAALEGPSFTAQAVAGALGYDLDLVRDLLDEALLVSDDHPDGVIVEVGYAEIDGLTTAELPNIYRFASPYLREVWRKYAPPGRVHGWQRALIAQLQRIYLRSPALVEERVVELYDAIGDPAAAAAIRQRWRSVDDARALEQSLLFLEASAQTSTAAAYQLFALRIQLCSEFTDMGAYGRALPLAEAALEQALGWQDQMREASARGWLGRCLHEHGELAAARPYYERALTIREQVLGPLHPDTAAILNNLGELLRAQGELAAARPYVDRALAINEQVLGPLHPATATSLNNLGELLRAQGELAAARPYFERALAIREQVLGLRHPNTATSLNNLGELLRAQGDLAAAQPYLERALTIYEQVLGPLHPITATNLNNLGGLLQGQGELAAARPYFERALAINEQVLGPLHPATATNLNNLGGLLRDKGELAAAQPYFERALAIYEQVLGPLHPDTARSLGNLGGLLRDLGEPAAARPYVERALTIFQDHFGEDHPSTQSALRAISDIDDAA